MNKPKIGVLIHTSLRNRLFSPEDAQRLDSIGDAKWTDSVDPITMEAACEMLADREIGVGSWGTPAPKEELLNACPKLKLWEYVAGSVKFMWGPHIEARNLIIASCAPANGECVAEMTVGEIIVGVRRILENAAANRLGRQKHPPNMKSLYSSVIGLIGASQVGRHVITLLRPFGCRVLLYDPYVSKEEAEELGVTIVRDLLELCASCDAVSIHTPVLPDTTKMLGAREFQAMHDDAIFINTARGVCIDEEALIAELEKGRLFAFLDVTAPEPAAEDSPLRRLPNVVLTSHMGGFADLKMGKQAVDDIAAYIKGESPRMVVTRDMLDRIA